MGRGADQTVNILIKPGMKEIAFSDIKEKTINSNFKDISFDDIISSKDVKIHPFLGKKPGIDGKAYRRGLKRVQKIFIDQLIAKESQGGDKDLFLGALSAAIYAETAESTSHHEVSTGLSDENYDKLFRHQSALVSLVKDDPAFKDDLQVVIDLDSTLFPLEEAMRHRGVDISALDIGVWRETEDKLGDLIMDSLGREDLHLGNYLTEEQKLERAELKKDFFEDLHSDAEIMRRAGVFEFAPRIIKDWRRQGIKIHILTHRSPYVTQATREWLDAMGIEYDEFICDQPDQVDKIAYCEERRIPVIIDDKPATIREAEKAGVEAISLAWPYSEEALLEAGGDPALCWRQVGQITIEHIEAAITRRMYVLGHDPILGDA